MLFDWFDFIEEKARKGWSDLTFIPKTYEDSVVKRCLKTQWVSGAKYRQVTHFEILEYGLHQCFRICQLPCKPEQYNLIIFKHPVLFQWELELGFRFKNSKVINFSWTYQLLTSSLYLLHLKVSSTFVISNTFNLNWRIGLGCWYDVTQICLNQSFELKNSKP